LDTATRSSISLLSNIITALASPKHNVPITDNILMDAHDWVLEKGLDPSGMELTRNEDLVEEMILEITTGRMP
jgi:hypothetical protein